MKEREVVSRWGKIGFASQDSKDCSDGFVTPSGWEMSWDGFPLVFLALAHKPTEFRCISKTVWEGDCLTCYGASWCPLAPCFGFLLTLLMSDHFSSQQQTAERQSQQLPSQYLVSGDQNRVKYRVNTGVTFLNWTETRLQMNANVALCLLDVWSLTEHI